MSDFIKKKDLKKASKKRSPIPKSPEKIVHIPPEERSKFKVDRNPVQSVPSNHLFYPSGVEIFFDCYSYTEIKRLSNANLPIAIQYEILLEGITVIGLNKLDLTLYDFMYINLVRKFSSKPAAKYFAVNVCSECKQVNTPEFVFDDLILNGLDEEDIPDVPVTAIIADEQRNFRPITVRQFIELNKLNLYYQRKEGKFLLDLKGDKIKNQTAFMAAHMEGDLHDNIHVLDTLKDPTDIETIETIDYLLYHSIKKIPYICNGCGTKNLAGLLGGESLIIPFRETEDVAKNRISFGT